jgi:hypothetical protein
MMKSFVFLKCIQQILTKEQLTVGKLLQREPEEP